MPPASTTPIILPPDQHFTAMTISAKKFTRRKEYIHVRVLLVGLDRYFGIGEEDVYSFFAKRRALPRPPRSVEDVIKYFEELKNSIERGERLATELGAELARSACGRDVWRNHEAAKFIERFVERFLGGVRSTPKSRPQVNVPQPPQNVAAHVPDLREFIEGVQRAALEKTDLYFHGSNLRLSLKSLIPENEEINVGSFPERLLFVGFLKTIPSERVELGSPQGLLKIFEELRQNRLWGVFVDRFNYMVDAVFNDVHCVVIEREPKPRITVYVIKSGDFKDLLKSAAAAGPEKLVKVWYRLELHAMRLRKEPVIERGTKITIDLRGVESPLHEYIDALRRVYAMRLLERISFEEFAKEVEKSTREFIERVR